MSRATSGWNLPPGVFDNSPDAPWNQPDAETYPCIDCGEDVGESEPLTRYDDFGPRRICQSCNEPLCRPCCDKAAETLGYDNDLCAKCAREERENAEASQ